MLKFGRKKHELKKKRKKQGNLDESLKLELIFKFQNCEILDLSLIKKLDFQYFNAERWNRKKINLKNCQGEKNSNEKNKKKNCLGKKIKKDEVVKTNQF